MIAYCDEENEENVEINWTKASSSSDCHVVYESTSYNGCSRDMYKTLQPVLRFSGVIMMVIGIAMIFYGARFILYVLGGMIFMMI